ncbi:hypothetical protein FQN55_007314 [Onygenales sp. PD_40]|nr:hypothetical protein FQN55_007314 [Onygenales sp. PD_40]KAK2795192.1 hypothetical protein FQN52_006122 [Onygenales sp. PD_12]
MAARPPRNEDPSRRPAERQNDYFIDGTGISREVIQADICRYLGPGALVKPGVVQGRPGYYLRAYRNLTPEMIADLKADSARWEAERTQADRDPRASNLPGSYDQSRSISPGSNMHPATYYSSSTTHSNRQQTGPSGGGYGPGPSAPYDNYPPTNPYAPGPNAPGANPQAYTTGYSPATTYSNVPTTYASAPGDYQSSQVPVTANEYTYGGATAHPYNGADPNNRPRTYTESEYPLSSGITYPPASAPDYRSTMDARYPGDPSYQDHNAGATRRQPPGEYRRH